MADRGTFETRARRWLADIGREARALELLPGDVSPRRYARVRFADGDRAILAFYPSDVVDVLLRFRQTSMLLAGVDVRVPKIFADDLDGGWMLLEDLGAETLFELDVGGADRADEWSARLPWYRDALVELGSIQSIPVTAVSGLNPPLDEPLLRSELQRTVDLFLERRGCDDPDRALGELCANLAADSPVVCHRDFMPRNLVPLVAEARVGVLDHQDLRLGPPAYDLASLLNDSLFPTAEVEAELLAGILEGADDQLRYHRAAAQRTLKAIGTFAACAARGSRLHERLIAPTFARALRHLDRVPETAALAAAWSIRAIC